MGGTDGRQDQGAPVNLQAMRLGVDAAAVRRGAVPEVQERAMEPSEVTPTPTETEASMAENKCIVWRRGGTENFEWVRSVAMDDAHAQQVARDLERMGYRAYIMDLRQSLAVGLPDSFES